MNELLELVNMQQKCDLKSEIFRLKLQLESWKHFEEEFENLKKSSKKVSENSLKEIRDIIYLNKSKIERYLLDNQ